jgi:hypothetical protein
MNKKISLVSLFCVLIAVMLVSPISSVSAKNDKFIEVKGDIPILFDPSSVDFIHRGKSNTETWSYQFDAQWFGGIEGSGYIIGWWTITKMNTPEWKIVAIEVITLTDPKIDGQVYSGDLIIGGSVTNWRIIGGTEELANIHGQGKKLIDDFDPFLIHYEGVVHFDP